MKKQFIYIALSTLVVGSSFFSACKKEESKKTFAQVNFSHSAPSSPEVNFIVGTDTFNKSPMAYGGHTGYVDVASGSKTMECKYAGIDTSFFSNTFTFKENNKYSIYVIDSFHKSVGMVVADEIPDPIFDKAHVRLIYLSPNSNEVSLARTEGNWSTKIFPKVNFKDVSSFTAVNPGVYNLEVRSEGDDVTLLKLPTLVMNGEKAYTIIVVGYVGASGKTQLTSQVFINRF